MVLLVVLGALAVPAGVLRAACAGRSCASDSSPARVPFCPLPAALKADLVAGFREGRSPDVLAVAAVPVSGGSGEVGAPAPWPALTPHPDTSVPVVFVGRGVDPTAPVPDGTALDQIAPTLADVLGLHRPHPGVRAGLSVRGVADGQSPRLILEIAWKGAGSAELRAAPDAWPYLASLLVTGTGTLDATTGSLPLDPTATLTTIGTGGPPSQHGITGTLVRNDRGKVVLAWGPGSPLSVISTLPDDLDESTNQAARIGLVATSRSDRGIIGGNWYLDHDRDQVVVTSGDRSVAAAARLLGSGFGRDDVPDVLAVVLEGPIRSMDRRTRALVALARRAAGGSVTVVVAGTGASAGGIAPGQDGASRTADEVRGQVEAGVTGATDVVAGTVPGGFFLDQSSLAELGITGQAVVEAVMQTRGPGGSPVFADAFQGFAVSFARYC